jgi:tRNA nucleotidyltransferase/poly(A) polymerase
MSGRIDRLLARPDVQALLSAFAAVGSEARLVGGAVRDAVMGRRPGDIDLATPMQPDAVIKLAKAMGWKAVPTGIDHGTVTLVLAGQPYEVTTLRRDVETDGRRAVVAFTSDWREDAFRRDFTLNALYLSADGRVHDYAKGIADAKAGIIRFMGDAETRIREDYLRILRFFRFQASHGAGATEPTGLAACAKLKAGLSGISRERVRQELLKLLVAPGAPAAADSMQAIGLWTNVLSGIVVDAAALRRWTALGTAIPGSDDPMSALAAIALPGATPAMLGELLKLSRADVAMLELIEVHGATVADAINNEPRMAEALYRTGPEALPAVLRSRAASIGSTLAQAEMAMGHANAHMADPPHLPFAGADLAALGVPPGPRMGRILKDAEKAWILARLPRDPSECRQILADAIAAHPH